MDQNQSCCVYCGRPNPDTVDHIPPACLFPAPRPSTLITVPSCSACNVGASKDDEYFKICLIFRDDVAGDPSRSEALDSAIRALGKPHKRRFLNTFRRGMRRVPVHTLAGLYIGDAATYDVDLRRFDKVTNRIVLGLFYHHYGIRLPKTHGVRSFAESGLRNVDISRKMVLVNMVRSLLSKPAHSIGEHVFQYWFLQSYDDPYSTAWLLRFYEAETVLSVTAHADIPNPAAQLGSG